MTLKVLALDPGERVGWAHASVHPDGAWTDLTHGITPLRDMALTLDKRIHGYDVVVMEDWRLYPHLAKTMIGSSFPSVQFVGMVRLLVWKHPNIELVTQGAAIKNTADKTLKALRPELYQLVTAPRAHDDSHHLDAIRHLWFWTWKNYTAVAEEAA